MSIQDPVSGGLRRAAAVLAAIVLAAATTHAAEPPVLPEAEPAIVKQLTAPTRSKSRVRNVPLPHRKVAPPGAGNTTAYGTDVDRDFGAALAAFFAGDGEAALAALDAAEAARANKNYRWEIAFLRAQTLIMMGRAADAEDQLAETARREIAAMGRSANTRALRGEARLWLDDFDGAIADYAQVTHDLRNWRMPTDFREIPSDIPTMVAKTTAQIRALSGLATVHLLKGDVVAALAWAKEAEARFNDVHYVVNHNLYGQFIAVHADSYNGRAQNLMFLAAAQTITAGDAAAGEPIFAAARKYFEAIGFAAGTVTVDAVRAWSLKEIGAFDEAARLAEVTVKQAAALGLADTIWRVEAVRGEALLANNQPGPAEQAFRNAQAAINAISGALATDRAKRRFGVGKDDITYRFVGFDLARGDLAALVSDIERGRARAFIDMLAGRAVASGRQPELVAEIRALDTAILKGRVARLAPSGARPPTNEAALFARRAAALAKLRQIDAELADVFAVSTRSLADVRAALAPGEVMAYTIPGRGNDRVRLLLIRNADATLVDADISVDELGAAIRGFVEAVTDGDAGEQTAIAALLGNQLGIADWGASGTLYVVPSGDINFVPWGALALDVPVVILPTGGWLGRASGNTAAAARAAAVGDPDFFGALPQLPGRAGRGRRSRRLLRHQSPTRPGGERTGAARAHRRRRQRAAPRDPRGVRCGRSAGFADLSEWCRRTTRANRGGAVRAAAAGEDRRIVGMRDRRRHGCRRRRFPRPAAQLLFRRRAGGGEQPVGGSTTPGRGPS